MGSHRTYEAGTPSWVDLGTPDVDGAARFYGGLFGWTAVQTTDAPEAGGYRMLRLDGRDVAGLGPQQGPFTAWTTYVTVDDADATARAVADSGGAIVVEPTDIFSDGRMAVFTDPQGAAISVWQPGDHQGADVVNEPGSLTWNELACRDVDGAKAFYGAVFGWSGETESFADGTSTYTQFATPGSGRVVAGMVQMNEQWPEDIPPHWMVYFAVTDTDAAASTTTELGGTVSVPPFDLPTGRVSVLNDPYGAMFSIITLSQPPTG
jgi:hypothetical protein